MLFNRNTAPLSYFVEATIFLFNAHTYILYNPSIAVYIIVEYIMVFHTIIYEKMNISVKLKNQFWEQ